MRRDGGTWILVSVTVGGIIAAMAGAAFLVYGAQWLGERSQEQAASATELPPYWKIHAASVSYDAGAPQSLRLLVGQVSGPPSALPQATLGISFDGHASTIAGLAVSPVGDDDGSLAEGVATRGDLWYVDVPLTQLPWPSASVVALEWDLGGAPVGHALLTAPAPLEQGVRVVQVS